MRLNGPSPPPGSKRCRIRLHVKGGKRHEVPAHHNAEAYLDAYLEAAGPREDKKSPLYGSVDKQRKMTLNPIMHTDVLRMVKRRAREAGLPSSTCCHTFRATGITAYLDNGGTIENAQAIAAHESPRTTKLYDRTGDESRSMRWSGLGFERGPGGCFRQAKPGQHVYAARPSTLESAPPQSYRN